MSHAVIASHLNLDPKRIAATSATIAVHVAVLMLLLTPPMLMPAEAEPQTIVIDWQEEKPLPPPPPPPPPEPRPVQEVRPNVVPQPAPPIAAPPVVFADATAMDFAAPEVVAPEPQVVDYGPLPSGPLALDVLVGPAPPYPGTALRLGITGSVVLRIEVDATGKPVSGTIDRSSGSTILDKAALKFVLARWRFKPAEHAGQPIAATALVPINYVLND
jgi:protein TonB